MNIIKIGCALITIVVFCSAALADPLDVYFRRHTRPNAAVRSALVPGWGQFFNGQPVKGRVAGALFFGAVGAYFYYTGRADEYYRDYEEHGLRNDASYADYEEQKQHAVTALTVAGGAWFLAVLDGYLFGKRGELPADDAGAPAALQVSWRGDGPALRWTRNF